MSRCVIQQLEVRVLLVAAPNVPMDGPVPILDDRPALSALAVSPMEIDLSWGTMPGGASRGYVVERAVAGGSFSTVATLPPGSPTVWHNTGLPSRTGFVYRLHVAGGRLYSFTAAAATQAYDAGLDSPFSTPSPVSGQILNILSYGATANNSSNDDSTAIKNAIAAAKAGDEVYIPNGVFHVKTRDIKLKTGVSIVGQSSTGAIISALFTDAGADNPNSQVFRADPGVNNLTLSNFRIEMSDGQSMQYGLFLGRGSSGVSNVSRIAVTNINIEGFEKFAIALRNCDNVLVQGCTIKNATALGGGGQGYCVMIGYDNSHNNWITGNSFGPTIRHAVVLQYRAHHNLIENNNATAATLDAYDLHGEDEYSNEIRNNTAHDCGGYGIGIGNTGSTHNNSGPHNWIHGNEVYNCRGGANVILGSDDEVIEANYFHNNTGDGILVNNGGGARLWILRNTVRFNGGDGAHIEDAPDLWMEGNVFSSNSSSALYVGGATTGYTIRGNDLRFNGAPIEIDNTAGLFVDNLV